MFLFFAQAQFCIIFGPEKVITVPYCDQVFFVCLFFCLLNTCQPLYLRFVWVFLNWPPQSWILHQVNGLSLFGFKVGGRHKRNELFVSARALAEVCLHYKPVAQLCGRRSRGCVTIPGPARVSSEQHQPRCVLCTYLLELGISPSRGDTIKAKCSQNRNRKGWVFLFQV